MTGAAGARALTAGVDPVGGPAAKRAAQEELARLGRGHGTSIPERIIKWLGARLGDLFSGGGSSSALLILLVALLAVVVAFAARAGVPRRLRRNERGDPLATSGAADHRRLAAQFTAQGRHAEALREWLRAAVATIEERGVLPPRPGRTGAATAREAGPLLPDASADLAAATASFDEVWFGGRPALAADVARARAAAEAVRSARIAQVTR